MLFKKRNIHLFVFLFSLSLLNVFFFFTLKTCSSPTKINQEFLKDLFSSVHYTETSLPLQYSSYAFSTESTCLRSINDLFISSSFKDNEFDYIALGGGSGGIATAFRAAMYGAKVAIIEKDKVGGSCVNSGCIPKKVMFNAASVHECLANSRHYTPLRFNKEDIYEESWINAKRMRDQYTSRLVESYEKRLVKNKIKLIKGTASFLNKNTVQVRNEKNEITVYTAKHIVIATGSQPVTPNFKGAELCLNNRTFFTLSRRPKKAAIIGGGYIGIEFSSILSLLFVDVTLIIREDHILSNFDETMTKFLQAELLRNPKMHLITKQSVEEIFEEEINGEKLKSIRLSNGSVLRYFDVVVAAIGRIPTVEDLKLENVGVIIAPNKAIITDEYSNTNIENIYAIGDVTGNMMLTPVAIGYGRALADRLFGKKENNKLKYNFIATVIFSHPSLGVVGLSEKEAKKKYGEENIKVYVSTFISTFHAVWNVPYEEKPSTVVKIVCKGREEEIVGIYILSLHADEMVQGFAAAMKMKITKKDFESTIAIHPTVSEEIVRL